MVTEAKVDRRWIVAPVIAGSSPVGYPGAMVLQGVGLRIVPDGGRRVRASRPVERRFLNAPLQCAGCVEATSRQALRGQRSSRREEPSRARRPDSP